MNLTQLLAPYTVTRVPITQPWTEYARRTNPARALAVLDHYTVRFVRAA